MRNTRLSWLVPLLVGAFLTGGLALAREISAQEAVAQAQREVEGKVLSVQTLNVGKRKIYRIKVLTHDGRVRVVQVPAEK
ncbi:MAG TPA: PepSY domain-containing protein [Dokdonella sp.]